VPEQTPSNPIQPLPVQSGISDNAAAGLAYFTFIPAIIFLIVAPYNQKSSIRFHAWQSILLTVAAVVINIALSIVLGFTLLFLGFFVFGLIWKLIDLCWLIIWLIPTINAFNGKVFKLPIIGDYAEKLANK